MNTFTVYSDPGHGWAKVPKVLLRDIDLDNKMSSFVTAVRGRDIMAQQDMENGHIKSLDEYGIFKIGLNPVKEAVWSRE
jgi:hypothetical protein